MNPFKKLSLTVLTGLLLAGGSARAASYEPKVGLQTWTGRNMNFDQVVEFAVKHKLKYLEMTAAHFDPNGTPEETKRKRAILEDKGLVFYSFGVAGTTANKEDNRKLFVFAKQMGIKLIVVEPKNEAAIWDNLEELVKEYDIKLAIHNHGITSVYGNPETVQKILNTRDKRIGVCLDVGHVTGAGFDAAKVFREYDGRVFDIHLKDKKVEKVDGKDVILDVPIGRGQANYKDLFVELKKAKWDGVLAIETDNATFAKEPTDYVLAAISYVKSHQP
jgi:sugar phosphate isomerase/epimerase